MAVRMHHPRRPPSGPRHGIRAAGAERARERLREHDEAAPKVTAAIGSTGLWGRERWRIVSITRPRAKHNQFSQRLRMSNDAWERASFGPLS